jgi:serine-type D-Ala-D-Ala carboxypeptidase (penicillin-binding protein 5/6)
LWCALLAVVLTVLPAPPPSAASAARSGTRPPAVAALPPAVSAKAALLMDADGARVLWQRNAHRPMLVASTTKILTALVAEETFQPTERLKVTEAAERVDGTRFGFQRGMRVGRDTLLATLLLTSANDAAEVLADNYPHGGREGFLAAMQRHCRRLGCTDSNWRDPAGLDAPGHRASAADLAIAGRALLARPLLARLVATGNMPIRWNGRTQYITNHNKLVRFDAGKGMIGVKTGYTRKSGHTLVAAQRRGGRTLIAVILDSKNLYDDARKMLAWGFRVKAPVGAEVLGAEVVGPAVGEEKPVVATAPADPATAPVSASGPASEQRAPWWLGPQMAIAAGSGALALLTGLLAWRRRRRRRRAFRLFL